MGGEQDRDKKGWNVDSGTEEPHVGNLSHPFKVGVQKIGRAPEIQDPDDWNGDRPTPGERMKAPITLRTKGRLKTFGLSEGNWDCATEAAGSMDISEGNIDFIDYLSLFCLVSLASFCFWGKSTIVRFNDKKKI
jgi:hypothetical protein